MLTRERVISLLEELPGVSHIDASTDRVNSIMNTVVRCVYLGRRTVAVGTSTDNQINGLLDLVDLQLTYGGRAGDVPVAADEVVLLLACDDWDSEAEGAVRTLAAQLRATFRIVLRRLTSRGEVLPISAHAVDDIGDHEKYRYSEWLGYLMEVQERPSPLVERLMAGVPRAEFRAYPMLSNKGRWSLRLEGLEVAQIGRSQGWVDVGQDYAGRRGPERTTWLEVSPDGRLPVVDDDASIGRAAECIGHFADAWQLVLEDRTGQREHTLESRILRGVVPIETSVGTLQNLRPAAESRVNWGSQFPTRWSRTTANGGRPLDVLLRNGPTPWAIEIKIEGPSGVRGYYRHSVKQAVLYRHFIREAAHLAPWFQTFGLDQQACRAGVVVPEFGAGNEYWRKRLQAVCAALDVELITVPSCFCEEGQLR